MIIPNPIVHKNKHNLFEILITKLKNQNMDKSAKNRLTNMKITGSATHHN